MLSAEKEDKAQAQERGLDGWCRFRARQLNMHGCQCSLALSSLESLHLAALLSMASSTSGAASASDDVLRILIASDMHLGYGEKDPIRGDDSFNTFAEVFQIALEQQASCRCCRCSAAATARIQAARAGSGARSRATPRRAAAGAAVEPLPPIASLPDRSPQRTRRIYSARDPVLCFSLARLRWT